MSTIRLSHHAHTTRHKGCVQPCAQNCFLVLKHGATPPLGSQAFFPFLAFAALQPQEAAVMNAVSMISEPFGPMVLRLQQRPPPSWTHLLSGQAMQQLCRNPPAVVL